MLLLFENQDVYSDMGPEEFQKELMAHSKWIEELGSHYAGGDPLEQASKHIKSDNKMITDGPFIEAKELVSGYYILYAENMEVASRLAQGCPILRLGGAVEVRQIMDTEM
jgi:hypothetical protein